MANAVTLGRLILLFVLVAMIYWAPPQWQLLNLPLLILVMLLDAVDGYVARRFNESSLFGAVFDIAVDRIVEMVLWVVLAHVGLVPIWAAMVFIVRGYLTDSVRSVGVREGVAPFDMIRSRLGRALVAGRFMRGLYNTAKMTTFGWALLIQPLVALWPDFWGKWSIAVEVVTLGLVSATVGLCLVRGVPVLWEFARRERVFEGAGGHPAE